MFARTEVLRNFQRLFINCQRVLSPSHLPNEYTTCPLNLTWNHIKRGITRSSTSYSKPTLTLYTKDDCSLCDEAMDKLQPYLDQVQVEKVDITLPENKNWHKKYKYDIPVFHLNGEFLMKHRANVELFISKLKNS